MLPGAWQPAHDTTHQLTVVSVVVVRRWLGGLTAPGPRQRHSGRYQLPAQVALQEPGHRLGVAAGQNPAEVVMDLKKAGCRRRIRSRLSHRADDVRTVNTATSTLPPTQFNGGCRSPHRPLSRWIRVCRSPSHALVPKQNCWADKWHSILRSGCPCCYQTNSFFHWRTIEALIPGRENCPHTSSFLQTTPEWLIKERHLLAVRRHQPVYAP